MTRVIDAANQTEAAKARVRLAVLVDLDFPTGMVRAHDGVGPLTFGGNTYTGTGTFGGIDAVTEDLTGIARPVRLTLSGVDTSLISETMDEVYQNQTVTIYLGMIGDDGAFVADPETVWEGRMDTMSIAVGSSGEITLNCEPRLRREPRVARYTNEDQQIAYSGDRFFDLLHTIPGYVGKWGQREVSGGRAPGGKGPIRERID